MHALRSRLSCSLPGTMGMLRVLTTRVKLSVPRRLDADTLVALTQHRGGPLACAWMDDDRRCFTPKIHV